MGANSLARRLAKRAVRPLLTDGTYRVFQALAMAWDIRRGNWTEPELDLVPRAVHAGEVALDLGANYGLYSDLLARVVGPTGRVYAFEPVPFTFATLKLIARLLRFRSVELVDLGVSDQPGEVEFVVPVQASGAIAAGQAHLGRRHDERPGKGQHVKTASARQVTCHVVRLDDFLPPDLDVTFIKSDIEGAELLAFRGAERLIARTRPTVLCEINPWFLEGFGLTLDDLLGFFFSRDYGLYRYDHHARRLLSVSGAEVVEDNYLFLHPDRKQRFAELLG